VKLKKSALIIPATALVALTLSVAPAHAGQRNQRDDRRSAGQDRGSRPANSGQAQQRERQSAPAPAPQAQNQSQRQSAPDPQVQNARPQGGRQYVAPERQSNQQRYVAPERQVYQQGYQQRGVPDRRTVSPQYYGDSRGYAVPRSNYYSPGYSSGYSSGRYYGSRPVYSPYYSFRPRLSLGFGIYLGYAVGFPSWYDPYQSGVYSNYRPGVAYGGVSLDIAPYDAAVYVDGTYMGVVEDFSSTQPPLTLPAGRHHIELQSQGFQPMSFDITVLPRQVIPYQGTLPRY
jgi:PEGA domain